MQVGKLDPELFAADVRFQDPLASLSGWTNYRAAIELLRVVISELNYSQTGIWQSSDNQITTRLACKVPVWGVNS